MKKLILSPEHLEKMREHALLYYGVVPEKNDNQPNTLGAASALFLLCLHENQTGDGTQTDRIIEHFELSTSAGKAPNFDAICLWNYCPYSASIALAKATPSIWDRCSDELKARLEFTMKMYAYLESFATSDSNNYSTGPALGGNYNKNWNPNYRLANVPVIIFATHFFGDGDMILGEKTVNEMLHGFDDAEYERVIAKMDEYGWNRAKEAWTTPARVHEDGTCGTDARTVLVNGGRTYSLDYTHSYVTKEAGDGLGVSCGGNDYKYHEHPLSEAAHIIEDLLKYNYSGGEVKSDHHYDVDGDGIAEKVAWIIDGSESPYQGQIGMMKEMCSGNRSSTGYCSHDFVLTTILISAASALGIYDVTDSKELWDIVKVGNGDFLYKHGIGYQGFATGSYGVARHIDSEEKSSPTYFALKNLWLEAINSEQ